MPHRESPIFPFTRQHRLLDRIDFHYVMSAPQHRLGADVFLLLARQNTVGHGRLGLIIAKKHVKRATRRNWVKRQCREYFRHHQHDIAYWDIVILAKKGIADLNHDELTQRLDRVWNKLAGYGPSS